MNCLTIVFCCSTICNQYVIQNYSNELFTNIFNNTPLCGGCCNIHIKTRVKKWKHFHLNIYTQCVLHCWEKEFPYCYFVWFTTLPLYFINVNLVRSAQLPQLMLFHHVSILTPTNALTTPATVQMAFVET